MSPPVVMLPSPSIVEHAPRLGRWRHVSGQLAEVIAMGVEMVAPFSWPRAPRFVVFWRWVDPATGALGMPFHGPLCAAWWSSFTYAGESPDSIHVQPPKGTLS